METSIIYQMNQEDLKTFLREEIAVREVELFLSRFHNVFIDVDEVARMHGVTRQTVYNYVKDGLLLPENREKEGAAIRFRLSEALRFDFRTLQTQRRARADKSRKKTPIPA